MHPRPSELSRHLEVLHAGRGLGYREGLRLQEQLAETRRTDPSAPDTLVLLEHAPVYTLGRSARPSHLLLSEMECLRHGIDIQPTARGGDVTYHGPGQLVGYPILRLGTDPRSVVPYVTALEDALLQAVATFGLQARRDPRNRGLWIESDKLAAIGVRIERGVTTHGFALNVAPDLEAYRGIVPCGLHDTGVTSMARLLGTAAPPMSAVEDAVSTAFRAVFGYSTHAPRIEPPPALRRG